MVIHDGGLPGLLALALAVEAADGVSNRVIGWIPGPCSALWADARAAVGQSQAEILARTAARALGVRVISGPGWPDTEHTDRATTDPLHSVRHGLQVSIDLLHAMLEATHAGARLLWPACPVDRTGSATARATLARMFALGERARLLEALADLDATARALGTSATGNGLAPAPPHDPGNPTTTGLIETPFLDLSWKDLGERARRMNLPADLCWGLGQTVLV